jgi:phospholipid/cholesterol/gamma-HCH transport system substrate-binding protein
MNDTALKFRIGIFALATLVVLAVLVVLFSGVPTIFSPYNRYTVVLDDAAGIGPGTPVRRSGVRIGEVESLDLDDQTGEVRVAILVNKKHTIWSNEVAVVTRNPLGDAAIELQTEREEKSAEPSSEEQQADPPPAEEKKPAAGKEANRGVVPPGSVIKGRSSTDIQRLLAEADRPLRELGKAAQSFNKMAPELNQAIREIRDLSRTTRQMMPELRKTNDEALVTLRNWGRLGERLDVLVRTEQDKFIKTLQDLDETTVRIGRTFNDENQRNLSNTLKNLSAASDGLERVTKNTDEFINDGRKTLDRMNKSLSQADELMATMQKAAKPMADRSERTMKNLDESAEKLNRTLSDAQALLQALSRSDGTFAKFINDPALYNNLNDTICMLLHILPRVDRMMKDMEVFADKIARHPEALGVGGAVRPSSGIK